MGSQSDWATLRHAAETLEQLACRTRPGSSPPTARRTGCATTPRAARQRGLKVIIAGAGGAAHLPGMCAAWTAAAGARRAGRIPQPQGHGQPAVDRADAGRHSGRHAGDRPGRRGQRRTAGRRHPRDRRSGAGRAAGRAARASRPTPWPTLPTDASWHDRSRCRRTPPSASSAAASLAGCRRWPPRGSAIAATS